MTAEIAATMVPGAASRADERSRDHAFRAAARHSRRVRAFKLALPALALLAGIGFIGYSWMSSPAAAPLDVDASSVIDGKLVMANPKLDGFNRNNLPYTMGADRAIQDLQETGLIVLENIDARVPIDETSWATIGAESGVYDNGANTLVVDSPLTLSTSDGVVARLQEAQVDIGAGELKSDKPVEITYEDSRIEADTFTVRENGKVFVFETRVRMTIGPGQLRAGRESGVDQR